MDKIEKQKSSFINKPGEDDPVLTALESYWQTLRHAQRIPARTDLVPSEIDHVLPYSFILQRVAPGVARFRVAGQRLNDLIKMDARGMPLTTLFDPFSRSQIQDYVELAFAEPAIISLKLTSPGNMIRPTVTGTILLLPMRDHQENTSRLLGAIVTEPHSGTRPRRFAIDPHAPVRHEPLGLKLASTQVLPAEVITAKKPDATRPALRLVVNNG